MRRGHEVAPFASGDSQTRARLISPCARSLRLNEESLIPDVYNLRVGAGTVDLVLERYAQNVGVEVTRRDAGIEVMTIT